MIVASAIRFFYEDDKECKFPQIMTGLRHVDISLRMHSFGIKYDKGTCTEGFLTDENKFLNRFQANAHALLNKQIPEEAFQRNTRYGGLCSEDIWPEE